MRTGCPVLCKDEVMLVKRWLSEGEKRYDIAAACDCKYDVIRSIDVGRTWWRVRIDEDTAE